MSALFSLLLALHVGQASAPWMTGESASDNLVISLVTFSPGDTLTEWWGHSALVVEDKQLRVSRLYNFGMFGPQEGDTVGFVKDFIRGRLLFWVADDSVLASYRFYKEVLHRDVRIQELDLTPSQAQLVAKRLGTHVLPEHRTYLYHHYKDNCSTRPRDILDEALAGQLKAATAGPSPMTLRQHVLRYSRVNPPMAWILDFLQADSLDAPITEQQAAYLPDELEKQVQRLVVKGDDGTTRPLVRRQWNWFESGRERPPESPPQWVWWSLGVGALLGAVALALGHFGRKGSRLWRVALGFYTALVGLVLGVLGTAVSFLMTATNHDVTFRNVNVFQASPLTLLLIPCGVGLALNRTWARLWNRRVWAGLTAMSLFGAGLKLLLGVSQANENILAVTVPMHVSFALLWWLDARQR